MIWEHCSKYCCALQKDQGHSCHGDDDLISLYVFGEEEDHLTSEAERNGGVVQYEKVKHHHHKDLQLARLKSFVNVRPQTCVVPTLTAVIKVFTVLCIYYLIWFLFSFSWDIWHHPSPQCVVRGITYLGADQLLGQYSLVFEVLRLNYRFT